MKFHKGVLLLFLLLIITIGIMFLTDSIDPEKKDAALFLQFILIGFAGVISAIDDKEKKE